MRVMFIAPIDIFANASAGAETINIYIKAISDKNHDVDVITLSRGKYESKNIRYITLDTRRKKRSVNKTLKTLGWVFYPSHKYLYKTSREVRKQISEKLKKQKRKGQEPDVVILETTSAFLLWDIVKYYFPNAKLVGDVHDISYHGSYRKMLLEHNWFKKKIRNRYLRYAKKIEVNALAHMDMITPQNFENISALKENIELKDKYFFPLIPYYETGYNHNDDVTCNDILFYGLMSRPENYESALWFIDNVVPKLPDRFRFVVMGGRPPEILKQKASDKVYITGFIKENDVKRFFENSLCLVVPLLFGSGIKTKVLSALSAGLPVLTNNIGIEGIVAIDGKDYLHCESVEDYLKGIKFLSENTESYKAICLNARQAMENSYNYKKCADEFEIALKKIVY